ncbi:hypothetical protein HHI36_004483 [Cryptolaemus montrouzieri]|uniref:C2H2-type domain-containing protein n=1 Tax=Cryptolaemus montrouzieri TaxID=559131 RepID=A0ABD2NSX7_9CUCU
MSQALHSAVQDIEETKKTESEESVYEQKLECQLCNIKVTSSRILERHLEGKKHRVREAKNGREFFCEVCDVRANSEIQLEIHLKSSRHKGNMLKKEATEFASLSSGTIGIWLIIFCLLCIFLNLLILITNS